MLPRNNPDLIRVPFDDHRLVDNAGLLLPVTLAQHLGLDEMSDRHADLGEAPGQANAEDKVLTLVATASTSPTRCVQAVATVCWVMWYRHHPSWRGTVSWPWR